MTSRNKRLLTSFVALVTIAQSASASQPPDSVSSDSNGNTAMGALAMKYMDSLAQNNTAAGQSALYVNAGNENVAFGADALLNNSSGNYNTALGSFTLQSNTGGSYNTATGYYALGQNTSSYNTATGFSALFGNTSGQANTAAGYEALYNNTGGQYNTAVGALSLVANTTSDYNTALGYGTLTNNTSGSENTALGDYALTSNVGGYSDTATGVSALRSNAGGYENVADGAQALYQNTNGNDNTAVGAQALLGNSTGSGNTATGQAALQGNNTGANNTAFGVDALYSNTSGKGNAAQGVNALYNNNTGIRNLGIGSNALYGNVSGSYNIALGYDAGYNGSGDDDIYIGNQGQQGESQTLRLGSQGTSGVQGSGILSAYVAGVATSQVTGSTVYITAAGQLGVLASSERFKTDVATMGIASAKLAELRPVTFRLKSDPQGTMQYGLIAEEVAKVYPELVIHGADGRIDGVRYEELAPLLLNEMQIERRLMSDKIMALKVQTERNDSTVRTLADQNAQQAGEIRDLKSLVGQLQAGLLTLTAEHKMVAQQ